MSRNLAAIFLIAVVLSACTNKDAVRDHTSRTTSTERQKAVRAVLDAGPQTKSWETPEGTVIELTLPKAGMTGMFLESQRCIVWRDAVTKTAALHCDRGEINHQDYPGDPPEHQQ